jgi:tetratricopeptide (TPR) repeat protein
MSQAFSRALLLYQQSRWPQAEQDLRRAIADAPNDADLRALLGATLAHQENFADAQSEVDQAVALAPDEVYPHLCRSMVLRERGRFGDAETAAREAVRLAPEAPVAQSALAQSLLGQKKWAAALAAAEAGLESDAEDENCLNLRAIALTKLGRQKEAIATADENLANNPQNSYAHANKAWALLHQGQPRESLEHYREALRLDPTNDYARAGMVEALKARNPLYRVMLAFFLWMARLPSQAQWGIIVGGYFLQKILRQTANANPEWAPWIQPLLWIYFGFALLTWFAMPLFNLLLRLDRFGRHALSRDQRIASNWFALFLVVGATAFGLLALGVEPLTFEIGFFAFAIALPVCMIYNCDIGWPRERMLLFTAAMALCGVAWIVTSALGAKVQATWFSIFLLGFIAAPWVANMLVMARVER